MEGGGVRRRACASCKAQRKRCQPDCIFAPYFPAGEDNSFTNVHKVFGIDNVMKILEELPEDKRAEAVSSLVYEANARVQDPVNGCFGEIATLKSQLALKDAEVERLTGLLEANQSNRNPSPSSPSNRELPF